MDREQLPTSPQEEFVRYLSEIALGGSFVFFPDHWRKGANSINQPADMIWVAHGCVFLMFMQEKKLHDDPLKNSSQFQKAVAHNMAQAKRCLRRWRNDEPILGRNSHREFILHVKDFAHVVVISVVQTGATVAELHQDKTLELNVSACATIPQQGPAFACDVGRQSD
jgi:hypothetical protein